MKIMSMDQGPLVSVILPTYNRAHMIPVAIESVLNQSYKNWELIIIDDGSRDNTKSAVATYMERDDRIKYHFQSNGGAGAARNTGLRMAKGDYVTFLDSDDQYLKDKIWKQLNLILKDDKIKVVLCQCRILQDGKEIEIKRPRKSSGLYDAILSGEPEIYAQTPLLFLERKFLFDHQIFFDESLPAMEDWDFMVSVSKHTNNDVVDEILYEMILHNEAHVHVKNNIVAARLMMYKKNLEFYILNKSLGRQWLKKSLKYVVYFDLYEHTELLLNAYQPGWRLILIKQFLKNVPRNMFLRRVFCDLIG